LQLNFKVKNLLVSGDDYHFKSGRGSGNQRGSYASISTLYRSHASPLSLDRADAVIQDGHSVETVARIL
jgi:hypothetical protein